MTHIVAISSNPHIFIMAIRRRKKMSIRRKSTVAMKAKGQYPSDKDTLQDSVELIFGSNIEQMKEMTSRMKARFFQVAIAGAVGSIIFYYLLLNHHI